MSHKKFGPDRFSRFDVYWIQTNKQTNRQTDRQTDKPNLYIDLSSLLKLNKTNQISVKEGRSDLILETSIRLLIFFDALYVIY